MKKFKFIILMIFVMFATSMAKEKLSKIVPIVPAEAKSPIDPIFDKILNRVLNDIFNDQYEKGMNIFDSLIAKYPDHPAPYFFKSAAYQSWMSSYRINNFQEEVEKNVKLVIEKGNLLLETKNDPWAHFYLGAAYGYRGFNRFRKLNFIGAYRDAKRGIKHFEKALEIDSTLYDVYLGLGSYYYWRTAKSKFIRIIAFWMRDKRELGLGQLKFTIEHGRYAVNEACYVLLVCYYDAKMYQEASNLITVLMNKKETPNLTDHYFKGRLSANSGNWDDVEVQFKALLARIENYKYPSIGYQVECKYWIAKSLSERSRGDEAFAIAEEALNLIKKRNADLEIEGHVDSFNDIKKELKNLHKKLQKRISNQLLGKKQQESG